MGIDLFANQATKNKLQPQFLSLRDSPLCEPAREMLREIQGRFEDPDGNFVEQFQTSGFDSRTFELFMFAMLEANGHTIDRSHDRPDFMVTKDRISASVEAVTANQKPSKEHQPYVALPSFRDEVELENYVRNDLAIRMGSPLFTKLQIQNQTSSSPACASEQLTAASLMQRVRQPLYATRNTHDAARLHELS